MVDVEKVIKALKCRVEAETRCSNPCEKVGMCEYAKLIIGIDGEPYYPYICDKKRIYEDTIELLQEQQSTIEQLTRFVNGFSRDAVPVVRCKNCKHKEESVSPSWEAWCNRLHCGCDLDWFCADGERR